MEWTECKLQVERKQLLRASPDEGALLWFPDAVSPQPHTQRCEEAQAVRVLEGGGRREGVKKGGREGTEMIGGTHSAPCATQVCGRNVCVCAPVLRVCAHAEQPCARTHAAVFSPDSMRLLRSLISSRFVRPAVSHLTPPSLPPSQASGSDMACLPGTD